MKKIYAIGLWLIVLALGGCESYLEEMPQNKLKPSTLDDYEQLLNRGYVSRQVLPYLDVLSDDIELIASNHLSPGVDDPSDIYVGAYMWNTSIETTMPGGDQAFRTFYESIYYANIVIENIENSMASSSDVVKSERMKKNLKGEALALRAYSYFHLVNLYAKAYDPKSCATDPGVPLNLSTDVNNGAYTRHSVKAVYDQMVGDLKNGIRLMEENSLEKATKIRFSALAAKALLARVYLFMQEWELAGQTGEEVLKENSNLFDLRAAGEDPDIYSDEEIAYGSLTGKDYLAVDNDNVLFVNGVTENIMVLAPEAMMTTFSVNRELEKLYDPGDVRKYYFMRVVSDFAKTKLTFTKNRFVDYPRGNFTFEVNGSTGYSRVIRIEEVYLILAEAYAHQTGGMTKSIEKLNELREMKFKESEFEPLKESDYTQTSLIEKIWLERRLELCFEGQRWFDLRRTTRPAMQRKGYKEKIASLAKDDPRYVLQIPQRELDVNPEIGINPR